MTKNYSKVRIFLSVSLIIFWICVGLQLYSLGLNYIKWQPFLILLTGSFLFTLNKTWADIISFFTFSFGLFYSFVNFYCSYKFIGFEESFINTLIWQLSLDLLNPLGITIFILIELYLLKTFYKKRKLSNYK